MKIIKLKDKRFLKNILTLLTGTTIAQAIPIAVSPILTRLYTPDDFGLLTLYLSLTSIIAVGITARYELSIMLPKKDLDAKNLLILSIVIAFSISLILFFIILIFGKSISILIGNKDIYPWLYFVPLSTFLTGIYQSFNYWTNRKNNYKRIASNRVAQSSITAAVNLGFGTVKEGAFGLLAGNIIGQVIGTTRLAYKGLKEEKFFFSEISANKIIQLAKSYSQFPKYSVWSALLNSSSVQMPIFILSSFFTSTIVGLYSLPQRVLNAPMSIMGSAVSQVFFQTASNLKNEDFANLKNITFKTYKNLLIIGLIPMSVIFGFGDIIFEFIFGAEWSIAGDIARILSIWLLLVFVSSPLSMLFTVLGKENNLFFFNLLIFISRITSLLIGAVIFQNAMITIFLYAVSGIVFWLWHCVYILKLVEIPYRKSLSFTISSITIAYILLLFIRYLLLLNIF